MRREWSAQARAGGKLFLREHRASVLGKSARLHSHAHMSSTHRRHFASDNYAGCTPEAWAAMDEARHGHATAYEINAGDWSSDVCSSDLP